MFLITSTWKTSSTCRRADWLRFLSGISGRFRLIPALLLLLLLSCNRETDGPLSDDQMTVTDMLGRTVVFEKPPETVIGLRAGALRYLVYLEAVDMVAGIEEPERRAIRPYLHAYPELRNKPVAGPLMGGDAEMLMAIDPDVIFMTFATAGQADDLHRRTGIPVVGIEYGNFSDQKEVFFEALRVMGSVTGKEQRAEELEMAVRSMTEALRSRTRDRLPEARKQVYVGGVSYRGARGINSTEPAYPPFRFINAENTASDINPLLIDPIQGTYVDIEQVIMWDPDVLFIDMAGYEIARSEIFPGTPLFETLEAVQSGRVYVLHPYNNYAANYETILANAWFAGSVLYPESFSDVDIAKKVDEAYSLFLGKSVFPEMVDEFGAYRKLTVMP